MNTNQNEHVVVGEPAPAGTPVHAKSGLSRGAEHMCEYGLTMICAPCRTGSNAPGGPYVSRLLSPRLVVWGSRSRAGVSGNRLDLWPRHRHYQQRL